MSASVFYPGGSIRTPFNNPRETRTERRILRNGRWVHPDPSIAKLRRWFRSMRDSEAAVLQSVRD